MELVSLFWIVFWIVVAFVLEETVKRQWPNYLTYAWVAILSVATWKFMMTEAVRVFAMSSTARLFGTGKLSYLPMALLGAALFVVYWYFINKFVGATPDAQQTAISQTSHVTAPAAPVFPTPKEIDKAPTTVEPSTRKSPEPSQEVPLHILYENTPPYNEYLPVLNEQRAQIGFERHVCFGLKNISHKSIEGVSVQMLAGPDSVPRPLLPQQKRVRNRPQSIFDMAPEDLVVVEIVSKYVIWNKSGKEWLDAGIDLVFSDKPYKIFSGAYIFKFQISARNISSQYIWLSVRDWDGKAKWKIERLPEGAQIERMNGLKETVSLHGSRTR